MDRYFVLHFDQCHLFDEGIVVKQRYRRKEHSVIEVPSIGNPRPDWDKTREYLYCK